MALGSLQVCCSIFGQQVAEPPLNSASSLDPQRNLGAADREIAAAVAGTIVVAAPDSTSTFIAKLPSFKRPRRPLDWRMGRQDCLRGSFPPAS